MIKVICGVMKSSKTRTLNEEINEAILMNKNVLVFYPSCCPKEEDNYIISRVGTKSKAIPIHDISAVYQHVSKNTDLVVFDEVQFISNSDEQLHDFKIFIKYCEKINCDVLCAGLDMDFAERTFKTMEWLLSYADQVKKLHSICDDCKVKAGRRSTRFINGIIASKDNDSLALEQDGVSYKSLCVKCYNGYYKDDRI